MRLAGDSHEQMLRDLPIEVNAVVLARFVTSVFQCITVQALKRISREKPFRLSDMAMRKWSNRQSRWRLQHVGFQVRVVGHSEVEARDVGTLSTPIGPRLSGGLPIGLVRRCQTKRGLERSRSGRRYAWAFCEAVVGVGIVSGHKGGPCDPSQKNNARGTRAS